MGSYLSNILACILQNKIYRLLFIQEDNYSKEGKEWAKKINQIIRFHRKTGPSIAKGYDDQQRHQEKVQEAIKNNLSDLVTEESIVMSNGKDVVKIPIRSLDEYKIRYNYDKINMLGKETVTAKLVMSLREMDQVVKTKRARKRARSRRCSWGRLL